MSLPLDAFNDNLISTRWKTRLLRAARLTKAYNTMDFVSPAEEFSYLDKVVLANDKERTELLAKFMGEIGQPISKAKDYDIEKESLYRESVVSIIRDARNRCKRIIYDANKLKNNEEKEVYIMKQFVMSRFTGVMRPVANKYYFKPPVPKALSAKLAKMLKSVFCACMLPVFFAVSVYLIYTYDKIIGSRAMLLWIPVFVLAVVLDILVVQPLTIYCRVAIDYSFVGQETHQIVTQLARISKVVLLRSFGVVKEANALIQYVNPACRAARMFPTLPICKLLMTLNDSDIKFPEHSYYRHVLWRQVLSRLYGVVAYLPLRLQTLIIDWVITTLFYCLLVTLYYIGLINIGLVVAVVLGLAFYFCYVEGRIYLANHRVEGADDNSKKAPLGEEGQQPSLLKQAVNVGKVIVGTNIDDKTELDESVISKITFKGLFGDHDSVKDEEKLEQVGDIEAPASVTSAKYAPSVAP